MKARKEGLMKSVFIKVVQRFKFLFFTVQQTQSLMRILGHPLRDALFINKNSVKINQSRKILNLISGSVSKLPIVL